MVSHTLTPQFLQYLEEQKLKAATPAPVDTKTQKVQNATRRSSAIAQRKASLAEASEEFHSRVEAKRLALVQFNVQWDAYIKDARDRLKALK